MTTRTGLRLGFRPHASSVNHWHSNHVSWSSNLVQDNVSESNCIVKYSRSRICCGIGYKDMNTLYIRSYLADLNFRPPRPTFLMIDNHGAVFMVSAQAPTKRTRHVEIRHSALLQWAEEDYIVAKPIPTDLNPSDSFTKATGRIKLYHRHAGDFYMCRHSPTESVLPDSPTYKNVRVESIMCLLSTITSFMRSLTMNLMMSIL
jgi:hypothetical protein